MHKVFEELKGRLIVSCQAYPGDPLEDTDALRRMALASAVGGAAGLRINSAEHIAAIRKDCQLPIIGIQKKYVNGKLHITPDFESAESLAKAGASIIALDCTLREWPKGESWQALVKRIHEELHLPVMADIATLDEALAAEAGGCDCVGTTLCGYTPRTTGINSFSWELLNAMQAQLHVPIMAEGHISTPEEARRALDGGAWCTIVGSAITRPGEITKSFLKVIDYRRAEMPAIGVDLGGTKIKAGLVTPAGEVLFSADIATEATKGREVVTANMEHVIESVLAKAESMGIKVSGLGIASAGAIRESDGSVFAATDNLPGWAGFELQKHFVNRYGLATRVVNDAQAAVLAELHYGTGKGLSDFAAITLGTGVGGGLVTSGKLLRGQHGFAGSIGHHVIHAGGARCNCGRKGCLEAYVSTQALLASYHAHGGAEDRAKKDPAALAFRINQLALSGDAAAVAAYDELAENLAEGIANIYNLFDPQLVILSGGLIEGIAEFPSKVQALVQARLHFGDKRQPRVALSTAGRFAGVLGAAALILCD